MDSTHDEGPGVTHQGIILAKDKMPEYMLPHHWREAGFSGQGRVLKRMTLEGDVTEREGLKSHAHLVRIK